MNQIIATTEKNVVIGMGLTGLSVVRFLCAQNRPVHVLDTRKKPSTLEKFQQEFPGVSYSLGALKAEELLSATKIIVSPGVALAEPAIQEALAAGIPVVGDIQLFLDNNTAPVVAITGSNAKSTVTTLVGDMAKAAGINVAVGGNIGTPVLDLLASDKAFDLFVLELSSFQLETINQMNASVACVLNISLDHMDRYDGLADYHQAKQRIYYGAKKIVINRDDPLTSPPIGSNVEVLSFGLGRPDLKQFGLSQEQDGEYLVRGMEILLPSKDLKLVGKHNLANVLAALAIGQHMALPMATMLAVAKEFSGLPHRCEWVATIDEIDFINDSKGTNVGASLAAIHGLSRAPHKIVLIMGGVGKDADFSPLGDAFKLSVRAVITIGEDGEKIAAISRANSIPTEFRTTLQEAIVSAKSQALPGDVVLLSPACASFDMFDNYQHRGDVFRATVQELAA